MIVFGIIFIIFSKQIIYILGRTEWKVWNAFIGDDSDSFKETFITKKSNILRVAGIIMILAVIADYILRKLV